MSLIGTKEDLAVKWKCKAQELRTEATLHQEHPMMLIAQAKVYEECANELIRLLENKNDIIRQRATQEA